MGGGALLFYLTQHFDVSEIFVCDINSELILVYQVVRDYVEKLIARLQEIEATYLALGEKERKSYYYAERARFNTNLATMDFFAFQPAWIERAAQFIFLNRTCFNGLYRVNSKGEFNVPAGRYKSPKICDVQNLTAVAAILKHVKIVRGDFMVCEDIVDQNTFVYFDPPYRPLNHTAKFTSYSKYTFDDTEQLRLSRFFRALDNKGASLMLSNSDPKNVDSKDNFFETLYANYRIERIFANRMINARASKRGPISELLIMNY